MQIEISLRRLILPNSLEICAAVLTHPKSAKVGSQLTADSLFLLLRDLLIITFQSIYLKPKGLEQHLQEKNMRRKSWISARIIIIIEMSELKKYRQVRETCEEDFLGNSEKIAPKTVESYFRLLQKLDLEILMTEIEISEEERTIAALQFKLLLMSDESKQSEQRRPVDSTQCEPVKEMGCPVKGCKATFKKASSVRHHSMITHHLPNPHWKDRPVFKVLITKSSHSENEDCLL